MKDEKILKAVQQSRQDLVNYMSDLIERTTDASFKEDLRAFRRYVERFEPCRNLEATALDRKIRSMVDVYCTSRMKHSNIRGRANGESAIRAEEYETANRKMFDRLSVLLENMLTERQEMDALPEYSRKELKGLSDFERNEYLNRAKSKANAEQKWNVDATLAKFEMERLKLFYERRVCDRMKDAIYDQWDADEANADVYRDQLAALDREIENLTLNERLLLKQIANHKELRTMFGNLDVERFIQDNQYAGEQLEKVFRDVASKTKELEKKRASTQRTIDVVVESAAESRRESMPKQAAGEKDKYDLERERRRQMKMERDFGDVKSGAGEENHEKNAERR